LFVGFELVERFQAQPAAGCLGPRSSVSNTSSSALLLRASAEVAQDVEDRLAGAGFVAADLGDVSAGGVGDSSLGPPALFARRSAAVRRGWRRSRGQGPRDRPGHRRHDGSGRAACLGQPRHRPARPDRLGADGTAAVIHTTADHPIWDAATGASANAGQLPAGDRLLTDGWAAVAVSSAAVVPGAGQMRDITVEADHTFYLSTPAADILVHNCDAPDAADGGLNASTPVGRSGQPMRVPRGTNSPDTIGGTSLSGHALDEVQSDGIPSSVVNDAIRNGESAGSRGGTTVHYSAENQISVVQSSTGNVVTVSRGDLR
jgi:hypothetical protein